jgi:hypothetical protein
MIENKDVTGFSELAQIEAELQVNFFADSGVDCATGTCS